MNLRQLPRLLPLLLLGCGVAAGNDSVRAAADQPPLVDSLTVVNQLGRTVRVTVRDINDPQNENRARSVSDTRQFPIDPALPRGTVAVDVYDAGTFSSSITYSEVVNGRCQATVTLRPQAPPAPPQQNADGVDPVGGDGPTGPDGVGQDGVGFAADPASADSEPIVLTL